MTTSSRHDTIHSDREWDKILRITEGVCVCVSMPMFFFRFFLSMRASSFLSACMWTNMSLNAGNFMNLWPCEYILMCGREESRSKKRLRQREKDRKSERETQRAIASLWSDIITCSSPGRSPRLSRVLEMARDINITRYHTWIGTKTHLGSRCTVPPGRGSPTGTNLKAW